MGAMATNVILFGISEAGIKSTTYLVSEGTFFNKATKELYNNPYH